MNSSRIRPLAAAGILAAVGLASLGFAADSPAPKASPPGDSARLAQILERFDATQATVRTLTADFTETKNISILAEPLVSTGHFYYTHPNDVLWEYRAPKPRMFLIRRDELLAYYPAEKRAQKADIGLYHNRLLKVLGIGQASADLRKYYDISLASEGTEGIELLLKPRSRSIKSRVNAVRIWVDENIWLPKRMQYTEEDGDATTIAFENIQPNARIEESTYRIDLPRDVKIDRGIGGIAGGKSSS